MKAIAMVSCIALGAGDPWTQEQKWSQGAYLTLATADMSQTLEFRGKGRGETNPLLGRYPSREKVILGITASMALHTWICDMLPSRYRKYWQAVWIGIEAEAVAHNWRAGFRISF